ncbi:hypothetical protein N0V82_006679 [Gnomoniopsis sp. IMI 355080]|nr:hypothetical protein N0V82_006679 [Gnomoniopsis sp. IMI 355080]
MNSLLATTLFTAGAVAAANGDNPTRIVPRATSICGQWDSVETGAYTIYQDLWNEASGTGSQCTTVDSVTDDGVLAWSTSWSWTGNSSQVKSFANTVTNTSIVTLADISTIPSIWSWSYTGTDIVADVAYDIFTSSSATGSDEYEIMIWLDALGGAGPISSTGSTVATPELAGTTWDLYSGPNGDTQVFSFVATAAVSDFDGDLMDFLNYLVDDQGMPDSQYLLSIGAGSEPFTGTSAVFSVASFSAGLSTGAATAAAATTTTTSSSAVVVAATTSVEAATTSVEASATPTTFVVETTSSSSSTSASSSVVVVVGSSSSLATAKKPCASRHARPSQQGASTGFGQVTTAAPGGKAAATVSGRAATPVTTSTTAPVS